MGRQFQIDKNCWYRLQANLLDVTVICYLYSNKSNIGWKISSFVVIHGSIYEQKAHQTVKEMGSQSADFFICIYT